MSDLIQEIFKLLTVGPGNLVVHLALAISVMAALQVTLFSRRGAPPGVFPRLVLGLLLLLIAQFIQFLASGLAWQGLLNPQTFLPSLDRAVIAWSLVWLVWLWGFPRPSRAADVINILSNIIILLMLVFSVSAWAQTAPGASFNNTWVDWGWSLFSIFILLVGLLFLLLERPQNWNIGLAVLGLNLAGLVIHLVWPTPGGDFSGAIRLAQLCSFPLLPALTQRLHAAAPAKAAESAAGESATVERRRYSADPRAVYAWLQLATHPSADELHTTLTRAVAQTMLADLCYLALTPDPFGDVVLKTGYDHIRDEVLPSVRILQNRIPAITSSLQRGRPLRLSASEVTQAELSALAEALGLETSGNLLIIPLATQRKVWGGLLLLSPYSQRVWTANDQTYLLTTIETLVELLQRADQPAPAAAPAAPQAVPAPAAPAPSAPEIEALRVRIRELETEKFQLAQKAAPAAASADRDLQSLLSVQAEAQKLIEKLQEENSQLRADLAGLGTADGLPVGGETAHLEAELRLALEEVAHLQNVLAGANMKILALEMQSKNLADDSGGSHEVIHSLIQELRQPLTSVIGYTELLMSESVGILGALQRKFMERIRASATRMDTLMTDLSKISSIETGSAAAIRAVDLYEVMDHAVSETDERISQKEIALELDLSEDLPGLVLDQDAVEQIIIQLLQNAASVTPQGGTIELSARKQDMESQSFILVQVTDQGGGIAADDLPRLFWRHYRNGSPTIAGIGDNGVGLSIARTLTEAQGGRIWVDSIPNKSATFSVLLPVTRVLPKPVLADENPG